MSGVSLHMSSAHCEQSMVALVDCNNFYASCERVFDPSLIGRPVGVLSNNDGCIIARSAELKAMNIEMGTPLFQVQGLHRAKKIHLRSSNYALYGDLSARVMQLLDDFSPVVERYSIDEAFLDLSGMAEAENICQQIAVKVPVYTGIPVSVGAAPSKTLAKLASHLAKKQPGRRNVCVFPDPDAQELLIWLRKLPVEDVWGIGHRLGKRLRQLGIETAMQLREANHRWLKRHFSVQVERTAMELAGTPCLTMEDAPDPRRNIMCSRSFQKSTNSLSDLKEAIRFHAQTACEKLRKQNGLAQALLISIRTNSNRFESQHKESRAIPLPVASDDSALIIRYAQQQLEQLHQPGFRYQKAGVMLLDIITWRPMQLGLFEHQNKAQNQQEQKRRQLMQTLDKLNDKIGRETVQFGLSRKDADWQMKMASRSPRYTTCWKEIPVVKAN